MYLGTCLGHHVNNFSGGDFLDRLFQAILEIETMRWIFIPSLDEILIGITLSVVIRIILHFRKKNAKKFRNGVEYGAARWGDRKDIQPYEDPVFENNILLTDSEKLTMNS
ncbi:hypothetical protein HO931_03060 [Streptococcus suis]|nr:hypothetical protein [Streptococcus suis]